ncbi:MAG: Bax inhibitor-1 family protein [Candidatus Dojkabacteria bacterium]
METSQIQTVQSSFSSYMTFVFGWMFYGMIISGIAAILVYASPALQEAVLGSSAVFYTMIALQLGAVLLISLLLNRINALVAFLLFSFYSALTGLTLSSLLFVYDFKMLGGVFFMTAGIYGVMATLGYVTKVDLSGLRTFFLMAILGIIGFSVANIFIGSSGLDLILSYVTILVFSGLTAYDMQRIRKASQMGIRDQKYAILDALGMYINFINIFLSILNIVGRD